MANIVSNNTFRPGFRGELNQRLVVWIGKNRTPLGRKGTFFGASGDGVEKGVYVRERQPEFLCIAFDEFFVLMK